MSLTSARATPMTLIPPDRRERRGVMAALDAAQAMIWFDGDGRVVEANVNAQNLLNCPLGRLQSLGYGDLIGEVDGAGDYLATHWSRIASGALKAEERSVYGATGTEIWSSITYAAIRNEAGQTRRVLAIVIDLTPWSWRPKDMPGPI